MVNDQLLMDKNTSDHTDKLVVHPGGRLEGEPGLAGVPPLPGDKSLSHRAALLGAMADGSSTIRNFLVSGVTEAMLSALTELEVPWSLDGSTLRLEGIGLGNRSKKRPVAIDCGNSATTLRLLAGAMAAWGQPAVLDGSAGLRRRPMRRIIEPLQEMGGRIDGTGGCAPLVLDGRHEALKAVRHILPVASAQVKSCVLLAALAANGETYLQEPGPSRDHTERMLRSMGVDISQGVEMGTDYAIPTYWTLLRAPDPFTLGALDLTLPGDMSAAAFLLVAALVAPGSKIMLRNVGLNPTRTGSLDTLIEMGAQITVTNRKEQGGEPTGDLLVCHGPLRGVRVSGERVVRMIDEFPAFAVAAACADGLTVVSDAQELRHKESDRISALGSELRRLGIDFSETIDGFTIQGGQRIPGGEVETHGDHRLAMSLALVGLFASGRVQVNGAGIIRESFPDFPMVLKSLGAYIEC